MPRRRVKNPATLTANIPTGIVEIVGQSRRFHLRKSIDVEVRREGRLWVIEYEPLNLSAHGDSEEAAYAAFAEEFEAVWENIAEAPDRSLTLDARELKAVFKSLVSRAEAFAA